MRFRAASIAVILLISGCTNNPSTGAATPAATSAAPKTFVYGITLNPNGGCDGAEIVVVIPVGNCPLLVQEGLVSYNEETGEIKPALAESWSQDGATITFKLRRGVQFHDGTPFNADAVVYNYKRVWDASTPEAKRPKSGIKASVPVTTAEKVDDFTVRVILTSARADAVSLLTTFPALIQSPTAVEKFGADYTFKAVGTGPYKLVSYEDKNRMEFERFDGYWGTKPQADKIVIVIKTDGASLVADLQSGAIDAMLQPPVEQIDQLTAAGFTVFSQPVLTAYGANLNMSRPPFDDLRVRQAANYAVDKETVEKLSKNSGKAMYSGWVPGGYAFNPDVPQYRFDAAKARQLLDEAGWKLAAGEKVRAKDGQKLSVVMAGRTGYSGLLAVYPAVVVSNLQDVGFEVKTVTIEQAQYFPELGKKTTYNLSVGGRGAITADPMIHLLGWHTRNLPPTEFNFSWYSNPKYDQLLDAADKEFNEPARKKLLMDAQKIIRDDAAFLWVAAATGIVAFNPKKIATAPFRATGQLDILRLKFK